MQNKKITITILLAEKYKAAFISVAINTARDKTALLIIGEISSALL